MTVAALFVQEGGAYYGLEGVDPWPEARDARKYAGPHPVVAHPPCSVWCQIAHVNQKRYGHQVGDDGGCFESALESVRRFGGVLEHPAESIAWSRHHLLRPSVGCWTTSTVDPGWVCEVSQCAYGHEARRATWLYCVGNTPPPSMNWEWPAPTATVSFLKNHGGGDLPRLSKKKAKATPPAFRDLLLSIARGAR